MPCPFTDDEMEGWEGFDTEFLGTEFKLGFLKIVDRDVAATEPLHYIHYSVVMNKDTRQLLYAASNIDQTKMRPTVRPCNFFEDPRLAAKGAQQLNNDFYRNNEYDRGHMVRRTNNAWGSNAQRADLATFFYTNCALQHMNLNQDEWLAVEDFISELEEDKTNKLVVYTGPIHTQNDDLLVSECGFSPPIPSGFFKIVYFINKAGKLAYKAYVMQQKDSVLLKDRKGRAGLKNRAEVIEFLKQFEPTGGLASIERLTGLKFPRAPAGTGAEDTGSAPTPSPPISHKRGKVFICSAMVNPRGPQDAKNEWVRIENTTKNHIDLTGWSLEDTKGRLGLLPRETLWAETCKTIHLGGMRCLLPNSGGSISLYNDQGDLVDRKNYTKSDAKPQGDIVWFWPDA